MVPIIKIENARGERLDISADPRYYAILTGTGPPPATINRAKAATSDGTQFNSATVEERPLLLTVHLIKDVGRARLDLYRWAATKQYIKVYYAADGLDLYVEGYIETVEVNPWEINQVMQIAIICPRPFWQDAGETQTDASTVSALFELPFETDDEGIELSLVDEVSTTLVENKGTVETGATFVLTATNRVLNPRIHNMSTGEFMGFNVDLQTGDRLEICTDTGAKRVTHIRSGVRSNYINTLMEGSNWLQMEIGVNEYSYTMDEGEARLFIYHTNKYTGV